MAANTKKVEALTREYSEMNVWAKLLAVRAEFGGAGAKKTGKNVHAEFMYFELADIVPIAEELFAKYGLLMMPTFTEAAALARVVNVHKPEESLEFSIPLQFIAEPGKFRMNEVQGVGAAVTYYRRYLYMIVLDLVESDGIDGQNPKGNDSPAPAPKPARMPPVSNDERRGIKAELTDTEGPATELQVSGLKAALKQLLELDPEQESFVQTIAVKTEGFTKLTKGQCEQLVNGVGEMLAAYETPKEG